MIPFQGERHARVSPKEEPSMSPGEERFTRTKRHSGSCPLCLSKSLAILITRTWTQVQPLRLRGTSKTTGVRDHRLLRYDGNFVKAYVARIAKGEFQRDPNISAMPINKKKRVRKNKSVNARLKHTNHSAQLHVR